MRERIARLFNNLPIHRKLLLASLIPLLALLVLSVMTYESVQQFSQDEEQLDSLYVTQKNAAEYMRLVVDLETGFRGYVLTEQPRYLRPYRVAQEGIATLGHDLAERITGEQLTRFEDIRRLVTQLVTEKEALIQAIRDGHQEEAVHYVEEGRGRELMVEIRRQMAIFDRFEQQSVAEKLAQLSQDRASTLFVVLGGGVVTFGLMVAALYLIARSITGPLRYLATTVGATPTGVVPAIPVLARTDEIGDLTRVMHDMSTQIRGHVNELQQSETALRLLNEHLAVSEAKYRGLVDHAPFGIFTTKGMQISFSNRYNQELAGLDPNAQVDPDAFRERIHPEDRERVLAEFARAVEQGRPCETVFRFLHQDGGLRKVLSRRLPIAGGDGQEPVYVGFNIDITALEDLQARLSRSEHLATLGQVAAGIAHELRNPLVGIGSTASLLLDEFETADTRRADIEVILKETRRLDRIVTQIVEYARPRELAPMRFMLADVVEEVVKTLDVPLQAKGLAIHVSIGPMLSPLDADRDQLKQVLLNVIHNAIDATPSGGAAIQVAAYDFARQDTPGVVIQVRDAGAGIPPEVLPRVFEPFYTTGKRHGTGLGLAICRNLIDGHGGEIHLTSEVGKGTTVRIWLPLSQDRTGAKR